MLATQETQSIKLTMKMTWLQYLYDYAKIADRKYMKTNGLS